MYLILLSCGGLLEIASLISGALLCLTYRFSGPWSLSMLAHDKLMTTQ
jgi:hypothetical protein